ncbi:MAG: YgiT-type zinc finger protein [bacterium]|nr:YgiT-type zinc finger protein [bacterium]
MKPFDKCPVCCGDLTEKVVEKLLCGGKDTAIVKVKAEVCLHCGERLYPLATVEQFEDIRNKLKRQDTASFKPLGKSFLVG